MISFINLSSSAVTGTIASLQEVPGFDFQQAPCVCVSSLCHRDFLPHLTDMQVNWLFWIALKVWMVVVSLRRPCDELATFPRSLPPVTDDIVCHATAMLCETYELSQVLECLRSTDIKGALWSFGEEIQTQIFHIYNMNEVIIQTQKYLCFP